MLKLTITTNKPYADMENGKPVLKYQQTTETHFVASTRGQSALIKEIENTGAKVTECKVAKVFVSKDETRKAFDTIAATVAKDSDKDLLVNYFEMLFDRGVAFERPEKTTD